LRILSFPGSLLYYPAREPGTRGAAMER
jgi:hypothetical protein